MVNGLQESGGSARTDSRAIQLAKKKKQKGTGSKAGASGSTQRKAKGSKASPAPHTHAGQSSWLCGNLAVPSGDMPGPALAPGVQCFQIQLLQEDPSGEGVLPLALNPQPSTFHPLYAAVDLPVYVLQEVFPAAEGAAGSQDSPCTGSTINLRDLQ